MTLDDDLPDPWTRQKGESEQAYYGFCLYRDQEAPRGLPAVVSGCTDSGFPKSYALIKRWSARWAWRERSRMWDRHKQEAVRRDQVKAAVNMARRQATEAEGYQRVLAAPMIALVQKLNTPTGIAEVNALPLGDLMTLSMLTARLWPAMARAEREARGAPIQDLSQFYDDDTGEIKEPSESPGEIYDWFRAAAAALEAAGIKRPELGAGDA